MSKLNVKAITHGINKTRMRQNVDLLAAADDFMSNILGKNASGAPDLKLKTSDDNQPAPGAIASKATFDKNKTTSGAGGGGPSTP